MITELKISCFPDRIPETIDIDVSSFEAGSNLHVRELVLPEGVKALEDPENLVFSIVAATKEAEPEAEVSA
jgi:large subunit ribosomal protein L25